MASTFAPGVVDRSEKSAENGLGRRDLDGGQVRQVVFKRPLLLRSENVGQHDRVTSRRSDREPCALLFIRGLHRPTVLSTGI